MTNLILAGVVVVFFINFALARISDRRGVAYWVVQAVNAATAGYFVVVGMPDLPRIADYLLAPLFVYLAIQNERRARRTNAPPFEDAQSARWRAYEEAIEAGRADARDEMNRP